MEFWEFLIQKDGDRSWLPLESPDVEVLEGRYRVVARTSRVNTAVEIRISHVATAEHPPKRRIQKRSGQTNQDGLIVVIPFTQLQPGLWELRCTGDLMADLMGESWQYAVKLQVLSHATATEGDWESDWHPEDDQRSDELFSSDRPASTQANSIETESALLNSDSSTVQPASTQPLETEEPMVTEQPIVATTEGLIHEHAKPEPEATDSIEETSALTSVTSSAIADSAVFQMAAQMSEDVVNSIFQELENITQEPVPPPAEPQTDTSLDATDDWTPIYEVAPTKSAESPPTYQPSGLPLQVTLDRDTYTARRGEVLLVSGRVELLPSAPATSLSELPAAQLHVYLRDPQTTHVLIKTIQPLSATSLPLSFDCHIPIAADYQTRLLLGELMVVSVPKSEETPLLFASQPFQVAADLNELLEAIANSFPESDDIQPPLEFISPEAASLDLTFLEFLQSPKPVLQFQPSDKEALPPQLQTAKAPRPKTVIHFSSSSNNFSVSEIPEQPPNVVSSHEPISDTPPDMSSDSPDPSPLSLADILNDEVLDDTVMSSDAWNQQMDVNPTRPMTPKVVSSPASPEDTAFRSLNLKGRFLSRLNALATDSELSSSLQENPLEPLPVGDAPLGLDTDLAAQEIVVVDDEPPPPLLTWTASAYQPPQKTVEPPKPPMLADDEPVPIPELDIPMGELTSGETIFATVRLPQLKPRIYVKLWIRDRQTRSLLDGPRWLVAFVPDGLGHMETRTQLTVPYGCLEAQFEAIAVEMATQRESNKTTIERTVMPPDLPTLSSDDVNI
jgi:hypothetical protein